VAPNLPIVLRFFVEGVDYAKTDVVFSVLVAEPGVPEPNNKFHFFSGG
jgi:hypothetical protein